MAPAGPPPSAAEVAGLEYDSGMHPAQRSRATLVAAAVLAVLLVAAAVGLLLHGRSGSSGRPEPSAAAPAGPTTTPPAPTATPVAAALAEPLTAAPPGVSWELFRGVALPLSRTDGPSRVDGSVHAGFTDTPTGALLAAAQLVGRSIIDPSIPGLRQIGTQQLAPGPGRTAYLALVNSFTDNNAPAAGFAQYAGFRYITYTPDLAVVSLATRSRSGVLQAGTHTLRRLDGDWKLELPATGLQQPQVVQDLAGYIPWSGTS